MGVELITNPSVIYLDEPTTGLDAVTAFKIVNVLSEMASQGRTVVCTIHQPNSKIFENFDMLMLLLDGNIIYQGDSSKAVEHFNSIGYVMPAYTNPADYFMRITNRQDVKMEIEERNWM